MIYDCPASSDPIRQGDIFYPIPRIEYKLSEVAFIDPEGKHYVTTWEKIKEFESSTIQVGVRRAFGIVASQNCDALRHPKLSLFEIGTFQGVSGLTLPKSDKAWVNLITLHSRLHASWFYLPLDKRIGFKERMAVNFRVVIQVPREDLESMIHLRRGRLNEVASEHYRECIAHYFRRYPYDEWYPLSKEEFTVYKEKKGVGSPFSWQA